MSDVFDAKEAAEYLRLNEQTVRRLARDGGIPAFKVGGSWRFKKDILDKWAEGQGTEKSPASNRALALIIDDEEYILAFMSEIIRSEGMEFATAQSGREGISKLEQKKPDIVFLDLMLPDMNGAEILKTIREKYEDLPVVMVTGYPESELIVKALRYSPVTLLSKPFTPEQIVGCVKNIKRTD